MIFSLSNDIENCMYKQIEQLDSRKKLHAFSQLLYTYILPSQNPDIILSPAL